MGALHYPPLKKFVVSEDLTAVTRYGSVISINIKNCGQVFAAEAASCAPCMVYVDAHTGKILTLPVENQV